MVPGMRDSVGELVEQNISCTDKCRFMNCKWRELMEFQTFLICLKPKTLHMFVESTKCIRNLTLIHKSELTIAVPNCRRAKLSQAIQEARERTRSHYALSAHPHTDTHTRSHTDTTGWEFHSTRAKQRQRQLVSGSCRIPLESVEHWTSSLAVACGVLCGVSDRRSSDVISVPVFVFMCVCVCVCQCVGSEVFFWISSVSVFFIHFFGCGFCLLENLKIKSILQLQCVCVCVPDCVLWLFTQKVLAFSLVIQLQQLKQQKEQTTKQQK